MKTVIIGGVAAGASAAARLRRLDENAEIVLLEQGDFVSYANCGLPYYVGSVISRRENLLVTSPAKFASWFNIQVRTRNRVLSIDRVAKTVEVESADGTYRERYDKLLIATGASPIGERLTDETEPRLAHLWTLADADRVMRKLTPNVKKVIVVGAGFIGLEVAENLKGRGLDVVVVQRSDHVLPTLDKEMARPLAEELAREGIELRFGKTIERFENTESGLIAHLNGGEEITADFAIISTGVRPNSELARDAGLELGPKGHIVVNEFMQTSDPDIYAAGDVVEVVDPIFGGKTAIALAGPANKQGRIVADNIAGRPSTYRGSLGANVVKVGNLTAASVGMTEAKLRTSGVAYRKLYLHPSSSASYYPGAVRLSLKLLFGEDGAIFGAQIVGAKGVDKRIDSIALAMRCGLKVPQLSELELAYAPPYSSAKDPVNFAGFVAENILSGLSDVVYPDTIPSDALMLDVREPAENELGAIPGAINIRLGDLRANLNRLDSSKPIVCCCQVGLRGYLAERILKQNGFRAFNLSGGWLTWKMFYPDASDAPTIGENKTPTKASESPIAVSNAVTSETIDVRALPCPGPVVKLKEKTSGAAIGSAFNVLADATFEKDFIRWCKANSFIVGTTSRKGNEMTANIQKAEVENKTENLVKHTEHNVAIVLFSNDLDKALAAMILANGLAASGAKVGIFFTFWGLSVLRKENSVPVKKNFISKMFGKMLPRGAKKLALSKMHLMGMGTSMMKSVMKSQNILSLPELIRSAKAAGVKFIACEMAMNVMGLKAEELIEVDEIAGVAAFADLAKDCNNTLFI